MATDAEEREWLDPRNWRARWLGVYVASRDPRVWVPKRRRALGWTLNFAHRASWVWLAVLLAPGVVVAAASVWARWHTP